MDARHASAWPYGDRPTWVFTSRGELPAMEGANLKFVSGEVAPRANEMLTAAGESPFWIVGGGDLAVQFADAGLLDEVIVTIVPVGLGGGKPLFGRPLGRSLKLTGARVHHRHGRVDLRRRRRLTPDAEKKGPRWRVSPAIRDPRATPQPIARSRRQPAQTTGHLLATIPVPPPE